MIKKIINILLNLIVSVLVLGVVIIVLASNTVLNKDYIKNKFKENRFYERTYSDIKNDFENYTMQSGLELEILDGLFTLEKVSNDIDSKIDYIYDGKEFKIETDSIRNELDSRISNALKENNRVPSENEKKSIKKYEDVIVNSYEKGILYNKEFRINVEKYLSTAKIACISGIVVISIILIVINRSLLKYLSFVGISLMFTGITSIGFKILITKRVQHILIMDAKFSNFLVNTLNDILDIIKLTGIIFVVIGFLLIVLGSLEKMKKSIEK